MKIEYRLSLKDYQEANKFHLKNRKFQYLMLWVLSCLLIVFGVVYAILTSDIYNGLFGIAIAIIVHPEINFINQFFMRFAWKNQSNAAREPVEIEVLEEGISKKAENYQSFVRWPIFSKFIETPNLFILCEGKSLMHIIPKRAFESNEQIQAFKTRLNEKMGTSN
jgi:hypothetical protein